MKKTISLAAAACALLATMTMSVSALPARTADIVIPKVGSATPVIDGKFDPAEGWGEPLVVIDQSNFNDHITKPGGKMADTSIKGYYRWDETNFYFCAVVEDAEHLNQADSGGICWKGDSLRFDMLSDLETADLDNTSKYWAALTNDGTEYFYRKKTEPHTKEGAGDKAATYKITRDDATKTTVYEIAAKWEYNVTARASSLVPGFEFVTAQRIMEMNPGEAEPMMSVQLCGYSNEAGNEGTRWFVAELGDALPEAAAPAPSAPSAPAAGNEGAPATFDGVLLAAAAASAAGVAFTAMKKRK